MSSANTFDSLIDDIDNSDYDIEELIKSLPEPHRADLLKGWCEAVEEFRSTKVINSEIMTSSPSENLRKVSALVLKQVLLLNLRIWQANERGGW
jgi:hypothetical protein